MTHFTISQWVAAAATALSPSFPEIAAQSLRAMVPMLEGIPPEAFDPQSIRDLAAHDRRQAVPDLAELQAVMSDRASAIAYARQRAIAPPRAPGLSQSDIAWVQYWRRRGTDVSVPVPLHPDHLADDPDAAHRRHVVSLIQRYAPNAWRHIQSGI